MKILLTTLIAFSLVAPVSAIELQETAQPLSLILTPTNSETTLIPTISTSILITTTSVSDETTNSQKPADQPMGPLQTLITIFNFLTTLLHNTYNQENVAPSLSSLLENVFTLISQTYSKKSPELDLFINNLKEDCHKTLNQAINDLQDTSLDLDEYKRPSKEEKEAKTQAALCNVATIVTGVANIVQNPHDKVNVGQSVGSILAGIINIAMLSSHKPH